MASAESEGVIKVYLLMKDRNASLPGGIIPVLSDFPIIVPIPAIWEALDSYPEWTVLDLALKTRSNPS